jgi:hypothetical protein
MFAELAIFKTTGPASIGGSVAAGASVAAGTSAGASVAGAGDPQAAKIIAKTTNMEKTVNFLFMVSPLSSWSNFDNPITAGLQKICKSLADIIILNEALPPAQHKVHAAAWRRKPSQTSFDSMAG